MIQAQNTFSDGSAVESHFFGLIDSEGRTMQFYLTAVSPDHIEDASHLEIVLLDFPVAEKAGSFSRQITIGETEEVINLVFEVGANHSLFWVLNFMLGEY